MNAALNTIVFLDYATIGSDICLDELRTLGKLTVHDWIKQDEVIDKVKGFTIAVTNKAQFTRDVLSQLPDLKLICVTATGFNNVDLEAAREFGVAVCNVRGYSTESVAQHTFAMLFHLWEHTAYLDNYVKNGGYSNSSSFTHLGKTFHELSGKKWGIIGMGVIGRRVAEIAQLMGCSISYYSTSGKNAGQKYPMESLEQLLSSCDIVSIHAPLNEHTDNLLYYQRLELMQKHAVLLNLGRGRIVNENDLARILDEDKIGAAGLDVLEYEPIKASNPLLHIKNAHKLLITPHVAWAAKEARQRVISEVRMNITSFLEGGTRNNLIAEGV